MKPLSERMRPQSLAEILGQEHLIGNDKLINKAILSGHIPSMIFWGPPGTGKTTLAKVLAKELKRPFQVLSAINSGVKEVREAIANAASQRFFNQASPILFIDEIHRFNKSQQDSLLGAVEDGTLVLIGATTENPSFEVINALLSRCQVYILKPLEPQHLLQLLDRIIEKDELIRNKKITILETDALINFAQGDARKFCNIIEMLCNTHETEIIIDNANVSQIVQQNLVQFDKDGELHYDIASAFIKSIRGSDPDAALYWLARMIEGGEDVRFIIRRMLISAAEDIGLANPNALLLTTAAQQAVDMVGFPESRIILAEAVIYLATSPKSNSAYLAIDAAIAKVKDTGNLPVPLHLRNAPTQLMKNLSYGKDYKYAHAYENAIVQQQHLPDHIAHEQFYIPNKNANEQRIKEFLDQFKTKQ